MNEYSFFVIPVIIRQIYRPSSFLPFKTVSEHLFSDPCSHICSMRYAKNISMKSFRCRIFTPVTNHNLKGSPVMLHRLPKSQLFPASALCLFYTLFLFPPSPLLQHGLPLQDLFLFFLMLLPGNGPPDQLVRNGRIAVTL